MSRSIKFLNQEPVKPVQYVIGWRRCWFSKVKSNHNPGRVTIEKMGYLTQNHEMVFHGFKQNKKARDINGESFCSISNG